jgi:3-methyladenine DNA glycosylase/8-oxoguanine DNA glycosylase
MGRGSCGIKGIGPWTISVFRIMVLRELDELPLGDVGLERAIANVYGKGRSVERLSESGVLSDLWLAGIYEGPSATSNSAEMTRYSSYF